jgi:cyclopropane-fatty-acyl-phospholipid synthase
MYSAGRIAIEGKIEEVTVEIFRGIQRAGNRTTPLMRLFSWVHWPRGTTLRAAKKNIHHHYDVGNDFYALWLDQQMAYTCAYFPHPEATLEEAQFAKFDHVCRKLRLKPNMQVIEAGCGWGGLALHMARHYGVRVQAYNISHEQILYARQRAKTEGLEGRVEFIEADWRTIASPCDVFVSVGMLEHVGRRNYRLLGQVINRALKPGGRGLIHSIGQNFPEPVSPWIERRIFPGGYPPALSEMMDIFEPNGFSVLDVENIRLHYAQTLQHWLDRFRQNEDKVRAMFDDKFVRTWRFYLAGSLAAFATGSYQLFQVVFNRAVDNDVAWTRDYLYRDGASPMPADSQPTFPQPRDY